MTDSLGDGGGGGFGDECRMCDEEISSKEDKKYLTEHSACFLFRDRMLPFMCVCVWGVGGHMKIHYCAHMCVS